MATQARHLGFAVFVVATVVLFVTPSPAHAYLDPAAGSMAFQLTVGIALAGMAAARMYWTKLRDTVRTWRHGHDEPAPDTASNRRG